MARVGKCDRSTSETEVGVRLDLDGSGAADVSTGIPFFDHMLALMFHHALIDVEIKARGDLEVDSHHTVEDVGLAAGAALSEALGSGAGITRFGQALVPMDECLAEAAIDISGRPHLSYEVDVETEPLGNFEPGLAREFFQAFVNQGALTLHLTLRRGSGVHHGLEACFKAVGRALKQGVALDPRVRGVPSTKGSLS